jgi:excinuclease ABC subunit A
VSSNDLLVVRGAREHNLVIDELSFEKGRLVVFTGVSGSGKSSLAFDTIYAEGQRRYVESLSTYARQFLGQLEKPKYEHIRGLCPTVAIEQKSASSNPRSTVGTVTEIYDYLRVLFARVGEQRCHQCGGPVSGTSAAQIVADLAAAPARSRVTLYGPVVEHRKGEFKDVLEGLRERGFARVRIDGETRSLDEIAPLDKKRKHSIDVVVDRLAIGKDDLARLTDSVETGLKVGSGRLIAELEGLPPRAYSEARACPKCNLSLPELTPQALSYNSPLGMCQDCHGLGTRVEVDPRSVVPDPTLTIDEGAVEPWRNVAESSGWTARIVHALCDKLEVPRDVPWKKIPAKKRELLLHGAGEKRIEVKWKGKHSTGAWAMKWEGLCPQLLRRFEATGSEAMREKYKRYLHEARCRSCDGMRLRPEARCVFLGGQRLVDVLSMTITQAHAYFSGLALDGVRAEIARELLKEIRTACASSGRGPRLPAPRSRHRLALRGRGAAHPPRGQIGSELSGVIYVLDEPSIGLHQRDNLRLIKTLEHLRDKGNTVIVVEHDADTILRADWSSTSDPAPESDGGSGRLRGSPSAILAPNPTRSPGRTSAGRSSIADPPKEREAADRGQHHGRGARGRTTCGTSTRASRSASSARDRRQRRRQVDAREPDPRARARARPHAKRARARWPRTTGSTASSTSTRSSHRPAAHRPHAAQQPGDLRRRSSTRCATSSPTCPRPAYGYKPGRFSFNVKGGRCEACEGSGVKRSRCTSWPTSSCRCEECKGKRFNDATLRVTYRGKSIAEVLDIDVRERSSLFSTTRKIARMLETLVDVGLGYIALGQPSPTLSGGEAQRVKLARELGKRDTGRTLYVLDEPTTGLHFDDIKKLLGVSHRLVDAGNTVLVIEHNLDVVKTADWVIDLGPEGGDGGGAVVAQGTPEEVATNPGSHTGKYLADLLPGAGPTADLGGRAKRVRSAAPRGPRAGGARP